MAVDGETYWYVTDKNFRRIIDIVPIGVGVLIGHTFIVNFNMDVEITQWKVTALERIRD